MPQQLTLNLPFRISRARGDFFLSDANQLAVARLDAPDTWPNKKLILTGPQGSGKTHLAHLWAEARNATLLTTADLTTIDIPSLATPIAIEVEALTQAEEEPLFHTHNHITAQGLPLLLIARKPPRQWSLTLPDLKSRMEATDTVRIQPPDDALLAAVMVKQFNDRQIEVPPNVIAYLTTHMDRSFAEAERLVTALDQAALAEGRAITRPLAQRVLDNRG